MEDTLKYVDANGKEVAADSDHAAHQVNSSDADGGAAFIQTIKDKAAGTVTVSKPLSLSPVIQATTPSKK